MNARAVCKSWKRLTKEANLEPLEAGTSAQEQLLGLLSQQHLEEALALEGQVWTPEHTAALSQHLILQEKVSFAILCYLVAFARGHAALEYQSACNALSLRVAQPSAALLDYRCACLTICDEM